MKSIKTSLLYWLTGSLAVGIALTATLTYRQARDEANEVFDYQMQQIAASLPSHAFGPLSSGSPSQREAQIVIQIWDNNGLRIYGSHFNPGIPPWATLGFSTLRIPSGEWRVYSAQLGETVVQIAQPMSVRSILAAGVAIRTVVPLMFLFPPLVILVWLTVGRSLAPILRVTREVKRRHPLDLAPIEGHPLPEEITPLVQALNELLARLDTALSAQRAFVADAAHELRSPLTALQLQIQLAERASDDQARQEAFNCVRQGLARSNHLIQQLLTLARQEPGAFPHLKDQVPLDELARSVVGQFSLQAAERQIDLGIEHADPAIVIGQSDSLRILLGNLIDNALRYIPAHGRIDIRIEKTAQEIILEVADNGPGIPEEELPRVLDRFYRLAGSETQGSGLGLAIVQQISTAHAARIQLCNREQGGLSVQVIFPLSA